MVLKTTLLGKTYAFGSVKEVLAKANEEKTGISWPGWLRKPLRNVLRPRWYCRR